MSAINDLVGRRYGRLVVISRAPNKGRRTAWNCRCDCGSVAVVGSGELHAGDVGSCGCLRRELARNCKVGYIHGGHGTTEHKIWDGIKQRCLNPRAPAYRHYGGRGITICDRWLSFENFLADMGKRPSKDHSINRVDNNGPYSPENCIWATWLEQNNNHSKNRWLEHDGLKMTMAQWARRLGINYKTFKWYIYVGQTLQQVIERKGLSGRVH